VLVGRDALDGNPCRDDAGNCQTLDTPRPRDKGNSNRRRKECKTGCVAAGIGAVDQVIAPWLKDKVAEVVPGNGSDADAKQSFEQGHRAHGTDHDHCGHDAAAACCHRGHKRGQHDAPRRRPRRLERREEPIAGPAREMMEECSKVDVQGRIAAWLGGNCESGEDRKKGQSQPEQP